jgi:hypothetical protein
MSRLRSRTVRREAVDAATRARMLALMNLAYEGVDPARFAADLDDKQFVILLYGRQSNELLGFSTIRLLRERFGNTEAEVLFSGDTVIHPDYWGEKVLDAAFSRFLFRRRLARPFRPLYWLLLSGGYKTYLIILNYVPLAFPRRDRQPPAAERAFLHGLAHRRFGRQYDPASGVIRLERHYHTRAGVAPVDRVTAQHPDIAFFLAQNPGHTRGDELVCLARVRLRDLLVSVVRIVRKRVVRLMPGLRRPERGRA